MMFNFFLIAQPKSVLEERVLNSVVAFVQGDLRHCSRPGYGQFANGFEVAEKHVGYALAFGAGLPGDDKGVA